MIKYSGTTKNKSSQLESQKIRENNPIKSILHEIFRDSLLIIVVAVTALFSTIVYSENKDLRSYVSKEYGFSFQYPSEFRKSSLKSSTEVARYSARNIYKVPVLVVNVTDRQSGYSQNDLQRALINRLSEASPGVSGFKVSDEKEIKLSDGSDAFMFRISWLWVDGKTGMETVSVSSENKGKIITLSATAFKEQKLEQVLEYLCMTLEMSGN